MHHRWMKTLKIAAAAAMAAGGMAVSASPAAADPSDPVCIMPPEDYCSLYVGYVFGSPAYRACVREAAMLVASGYCDE